MREETERSISPLPMEDVCVNADEDKKERHREWNDVEFQASVQNIR